MFFNWNQKSCVADYSALSSRLFFYNFVKFQNSLSAPMYSIRYPTVSYYWMFSCHSWQCVFSCCCHLLKLLAKSLTMLYCTEYAHVTTVHSLVLYTVEAASHFPLKKCCLWISPLDPIAVCDYHHWIQLLFLNTTTGFNCCLWIPPLDPISRDYLFLLRCLEWHMRECARSLSAEPSADL